jgi:hypothetical protein
MHFYQTPYCLFLDGFLTLTADIPFEAESKQRNVSLKKEDNTSMQQWKIELIN